MAVDMENIDPSLVILEEDDIWYEDIHGEGEDTDDLGGQNGPNNVAVKQLIGRVNNNKNEIIKNSNALLAVGGLKNLWIDGAMRIWDDGESGECLSYGGVYQYGIMIIRGKELTGGSAAWAKVVDNNNQWLKLTHANAISSGYICQRWTRDTLRHLKGKTVTLSFLYKCGTDMKGNIQFYNEQDLLHDGVGVTMAYETVQYIGDNMVHRMELTVTLSDDNIIPDNNAYFGIQIGYGGNVSGGDAIPNGSIQFSDIQFEINDKASDFEYIDEALDLARYEMYYQVERSRIFIDGYTVTEGYIQTIYSYSNPMRIPPAIKYIGTASPAHNIKSSNASRISKTSFQFLLRSITEGRLYKEFTPFILDARIR